MSATGRDEKFDATILVVDDKEDNRALLRVQLRAGGYRVLEADSREDALAKVGELIEAKQPPDLVLLDVQMPAGGRASTSPGGSGRGRRRGTSRSSC